MNNVFYNLHWPSHSVLFLDSDKRAGEHFGNHRGIYKKEHAHSNELPSG